MTDRSSNLNEKEQIPKQSARGSDELANKFYEDAFASAAKVTQQRWSCEQSKEPSFESEWRPAGILDQISKLTPAEKAMLNQVESAFSGNLVSLCRLMEQVNPEKDGNLTDRIIFANVLGVFQLEFGQLGFELNYDAKRGVLQIVNREPDKRSSYLQSLAIDPVRHCLSARRTDERKLLSESLYFDTSKEKGTERSTAFGPPLKQYSSDISAEKVQEKYGALLRDQMALRIESIQHQKLSEWNAERERQRTISDENEKEYQSNNRRRMRADYQDMLLAEQQKP